MSDLQDLIARSGYIAYEQGRRDERLHVLKLAMDASVENDIGRYVYLSDLSDYIEIDEEERNAKTARQGN